ncbi:MAG: glycoside hydrolase family 13 protein [Planctomycetes bacterium]|nr:glycoside hydrolase family 13 protein [Planctomycetota bacterium]
MEAKTPDWVKDAIFYQIFPDRFAASPEVPKPGPLEPWDAPPTHCGFKGGDLVGIAEHLDYLTDLGIDAIYLNPIFQSASNHRYHTHDYEQVDPLLGGNEALEELLPACRARGMRVVLDGVFNHASRGFFPFHHILETGSASPYLDWFRIRGFPLRAYDEHRPPNYAAWCNLPALPEFNTDNPEVREFLWGVATRWVERGIDGWRLDVPSCIDDDEFWREFRRRVKAANPEAYIVGEIWTDARRWLQGDQFDAVMNYLFTKACMGFFIGERLDRTQTHGLSYSPVYTLDARAFAAAIDRLLSMYPVENLLAQMNLLGSHDTARYLTLARGDETALRLSTLFQMTFVGAPSIYYGDEIGLQGTRDPGSRNAFPWDETAWNQGLLGFFRRATRLRRRFAALRRGSFRALYAEADVYAFARRHGREAVVVALNAAWERRTVRLPVMDLLPEGTRLVEVWAGEGGTESDRDETRIRTGRIELALEPRSGSVTVAEL